MTRRSDLPGEAFGEPLAEPLAEPFGEPQFLLKVVTELGPPKRRFPLVVGKHVIGSAADAAVCLPVEGVSRSHAHLEVLADDGSILEDAGSCNGTFLGDRRIGRCALAGGELLAFGSLVLRLESLDPGRARIAIDGALRARPVAPIGDLSRGSTVGLALEERACAASVPSPAN